MSYQEIIKSYKILKDYKDRLNSKDVSDLIAEIGSKCIDYLLNQEVVELKSIVPNKTYFAYTNKKAISRSVREDLFDNDKCFINRFVNALKLNDYTSMNSLEITKACYTIAIAFCAVIDLEKSGDQKTPGTFFEYFIGHCISRRLGVLPSKRLDVLNLDMKTTLPTDFIFDLGNNRPKFHCPVKTSTRERVIQVWAHQRVLDGVYGTGRFLGMLSCLSETKLDRKKLQVVEICLPDQWIIYQLFIAQLTKIYYLDIPERYLKLNESFPSIPVAEFGDFFLAKDLKTLS